MSLCPLTIADYDVNDNFSLKRKKKVPINFIQPNSTKDP